MSPKNCDALNQVCFNGSFLTTFDGTSWVISKTKVSRSQSLARAVLKKGKKKQLRESDS